MKLHQVIRRPLVTEKSTLAREEGNVITFAVNPAANKYEIRGAVEELFKVTVIDVKTIRMPRKTRRVGKHSGKRPEWKKAMVRLAEGQSIEFFEGV